MKKIVGVPEAEEFVRRGLRFVPISHLDTDIAQQMGCIDGRRTKEPELLGRKPHSQKDRVAMPGGALGLVALPLCALHVALIDRWEKAGDSRAISAKKVFNFGRMIDCMERILGGMSCHTDDKELDDPLPCKGCGHAKGFLRGGYGLGDTYRADMVAYLEGLKRRALEGDEGALIEVYHGTHQESAVLRLQCDLSLGEFLSIAPNDDRSSVFVFSEEMALELLRRTTGILYEEMRSDFKEHGVSKNELLAYVGALYHQHARTSAFALAHNLPVFDVIHVGRGRVEVRKSELRY